MKLLKQIQGLSLFAGLAILLSGALQPAVAQSLPVISPASGSAPAPAALTVNMLAQARPTVFFLERASLLAQTKAVERRLRRFARGEAGEQASAGAKLDAAVAPAHVSLDPLDSAASLGAAVDHGAETVLSALPPVLQTPGAKAILADRTISAENAAALTQLPALDGQAFDTLYVETQIKGLRRLERLYRDYTQDGDDQALLAVTVPELRSVKARIAALR
jgi:predicted outer membrane protein